MKSSNPKNNNPSGNPETLTPFKKKWKSGKTRTIRVPVTLADKGLELIRLLDDGKSLIVDTSGQSSEPEFNETEVADRSKPSTKKIAEQNFNKQKIAALAREAFAAKSNAGGQIKELLAEILVEIDIPVKKEGRRWVVDDTSATDETNVLQ